MNFGCEMKLLSFSLTVFNNDCFMAFYLQSSLQVCNPAHLVPVPSQDKLGRLWQEGHQRKIGGMIEVGTSMVRMGWRPAGL